MASERTDGERFAWLAERPDRILESDDKSFNLYDRGKIYDDDEWIVAFYKDHDGDGLKALRAAIDRAIDAEAKGGGHDES